MMNALLGEIIIKLEKTAVNNVTGDGITCLGSRWDDLGSIGAQDETMKQLEQESAKLAAGGEQMDVTDVKKVVKRAEETIVAGNRIPVLRSEIKLSEKNMYQLGKHFNKHGRSMGYAGKKEYQAAARKFVEDNLETAQIFEGQWTSNTGVQKQEMQIIIRADGKQVIINKKTWQLIDFYEGTSLDGFIEIVEVK